MDNRGLSSMQIDWVSTGTAIEHRRRQNRINQRAQRKRRQLCDVDRSTPCIDTAPSDQATEALLARLSSTHCFNNVKILGANANASTHPLSLLENAVRTAYAARSPRTDILLGLTQLNVYRALVVNIEVLGLTASEMHDDALSPFSISDAYNSRFDNLPVPLQPTSVQRKVQHHPWLDLLPDAVFRNNLILLDAAGLLDEDQCCIDMCGHQGLVVWKDPWNSSGWEVTPASLEKWRLALTGC